MHKVIPKVRRSFLLDLCTKNFFFFLEEHQNHHNKLNLSKWRLEFNKDLLEVLDAGGGETLAITSFK